MVSFSGTLTEKKDITTNGNGHATVDAPPTYDEVEASPPVSLPLNLDQTAGSPQNSTVTRDQCVVHLKLLAALADLRDSVAAQDGLFGLYDREANEYPERKDETLARIREKRWSVFTTRAVERYSAWWKKCLPSSESRPTLRMLQDSNYDKVTECSAKINWRQEDMPPLDVLMVWHSHMLNPRNFLEDCIRYGKMSFWATGFPWAVVNACLNDQSLEYDPGDTARATFRKTGLAWDNLQGMERKEVGCPSCGAQVHVRWSAGRIPHRAAMPFDQFYGFADKSFNATCRHCRFIITHDWLRLGKFRKDVWKLVEHDWPMPGTFYNLKGIPERVDRYKNPFQSFFPNQFIKAVGRNMLDVTHPTIGRCKNMEQLRDELAPRVTDRDTLSQMSSGSFRRSLTQDLTQEEKVSFRRMMSNYWENVSMFSMDLVGAVIRQGTFVEKMDKIDWLHSPTVTTTMGRLIKKYETFFYIMVSNPKRMAVPTLDVDLAWHTHQLSPSRYFHYSIHNSKEFSKDPVFIDHDDKVDENKLSDGFEYTSKMYKKVTNGAIYSECTCWYCEAIRESDLHGSIFSSSATSRARQTATTLHDRPDISTDPNKNPHISTHNAVIPETRLGHYTVARRLKTMQLQRSYERACRRAEKRERRNSKSEGKRRSTDNGDITPAYAIPLVWGVPVAVPFYAPYMCDPGVHSDAYASNPACMNLIPGGYGNCAAGTCGGGVAAGSCGGMSGGTCSGGCAGTGAACGGGVLRRGRLRRRRRNLWCGRLRRSWWLWRRGRMRWWWWRRRRMLKSFLTLISSTRTLDESLVTLMIYRRFMPWEWDMAM